MWDLILKCLRLKNDSRNFQLPREDQIGRLVEYPCTIPGFMTTKDLIGNRETYIVKFDRVASAGVVGAGVGTKRVQEFPSKY